MEYKIIKKERAYNGFFKIDKFTVSHRNFDGTDSVEKTIEVFERGDSCAALIFEQDTNCLLFTYQFRLPALKDGGWVLDLVAGSVEVGEEPAQTMAREIEEEIGYAITSLLPLYKFYVSPGGTSERIFLFYAETNSTEKTTVGGGKPEEGEDIQLVKIPVTEIEERISEIIDAKSLIAVQWFLMQKRSHQNIISDEQFISGNKEAKAPSK